MPRREKKCTLFRGVSGGPFSGPRAKPPDFPNFGKFSGIFGRISGQNRGSGTPISGQKTGIFPGKSRSGDAKKAHAGCVVGRRPYFCRKTKYSEVKIWQRYDGLSLAPRLLLRGCYTSPPSIQTSVGLRGWLRIAIRPESPRGLEGRRQRASREARGPTDKKGRVRE